MSSTNTYNQNKDDGFITVMSDYQISQMKSRLRAMERKRDNIAIDIARMQNLPNIWTIDMIDWTDPQAKELHPAFSKLDCDITQLKWSIAEAEAIRDNTTDFFYAERAVYAFLGRLPAETALAYLKSLGLTTHGLIGKVAENPDFIGETFRRENYD